MPRGTLPSPEEFFTQCVANARVLDAAARRLLADGDRVGAMACAWGSDVFTVQAVLWERVLVAAPVPARKYFRAAEAMFAPQRIVGGATAGPAVTADEMISLGRIALMADFEPSVRLEITDQWADITYLRQAPAPTTEDLAVSVTDRLAGRTPEAFAAARRMLAGQAMDEAQALRVRGETQGAVQAAYDADLLCLEAYLVESAVAAGDAALLTVRVRWELATAAISGLLGLPNGFVAAVTALRDAITGSMVTADAERLRGTFVAI